MNITVSNRIVILFIISIIIVNNIILVNAVLTKSYLTYLYHTYQSEINNNRQLFTDLCNNNNDLRVDSDFGEIIYMQLRELKAASAVEIV